MAVSIESFAFILLSVCRKDPGEAISFLLGISKFGAELLDEPIGLVFGLGKFSNGFLKICYFFL